MSTFAATAAPPRSGRSAHPEPPCPVCGCRLGSADPFNTGPGRPEVGDVLLCGGCIELLRLRADFTLEVLTHEQYRGLPPPLRRCVVRALKLRSAITRRLAEAASAEHEPVHLPAYTIDANISITCHRCGLTSTHPQDVKNHYCGACHLFLDDIVMTSWCIYRRGQWHPNQFRLLIYDKFADGSVKARGAQQHVGRSLDELRRLVPTGLINIGRYDGDDPDLCETWI